MRYLITGGAGFLGSNLGAEVLTREEELFVLDDFSRVGSEQNVRWLEERGPVTCFRADVRDQESVDAAVRAAAPDVVFHMAGQVAMTTSLSDPRRDFQINALGGLNVLEAVRAHAPAALVVYSSTNKVYGDLAWVRYAETETRYLAVEHPYGFDESTPLAFSSPYGCSKGAADQYMLDYARVFDLDTTVLRHSSVFGDRQFSTEDQGWVAWFVSRVAAHAGAAAAPLTISGDGKQVRDILFVSDLVECYFAVVRARSRCRGHAFNIGGGPERTLSLLELFALLERKLGTPVAIRHLPWRQSDQKVFVADIRKAGEMLDWKPAVGVEAGIDRVVEWVTGL